MEKTVEETLTDIFLEAREKFKRNNGRLLTVEEAIKLTEIARKETRKGKDAGDRYS